jgi:hypothetical protein
MRSARSLLLLHTLLAVSLAVAGCVRGPDGRGPEPNKVSRDMANLRVFTESIAKADTLTLYEGLPHPRAERALYNQEVKAKTSMKQHGHDFYPGVINVTPEHVTELKNLMTAPYSFHENNGVPKKCDGFHPDYIIEWHVGDEAYQALICTGCWEMIAYGPNQDLYCDMEPEARNKFKAILFSYRKNRPEPGR